MVDENLDEMITFTTAKLMMTFSVMAVTRDVEAIPLLPTTDCLLLTTYYLLLTTTYY